jgi:RNA polymerase sigma-70 factor (ECF subfamily)
MEQSMPAQASPRPFEEHVLPHLNAAYNLARWLTANSQDAEDVVQEACLRAYRFFGGFRGGDARAWLLKIVRNTCYTWLQRNRAPKPTTPFDEEMHSPEGGAPDPSSLLAQKADRQLIQQALTELPRRFREVLVLRELEGLSYEEIAEVAGIPKGTVMSSLARARRRLRESVINLLAKDSCPAWRKSHRLAGHPPTLDVHTFGFPQAGGRPLPSSGL